MALFSMSLRVIREEGRPAMRLGWLIMYFALSTLPTCQSRSVSAVGYNISTNNTKLIIWDADTGKRVNILHLPSPFPVQGFQRGVGGSTKTTRGRLSTVAFPATKTVDGVTGLNIVAIAKDHVTTFVPFIPYTSISSVHLFQHGFRSQAMPSALGVTIAASQTKLGHQAYTNSIPGRQCKVGAACFQDADCGLAGSGCSCTFPRSSDPVFGACESSVTDASSVSMYDVVLFNDSDTHTLTSLFGSFPIYPQISCVDEVAGVLMVVLDDGKYPCFDRISLTTGETFGNTCPSVNPDDALWWISGVRAPKLVALVSWPLGPGYDPRVHKMVQVDSTSGQAEATLVHNLSQVESVIPAAISVLNDNNSTDMIFFIYDHAGNVRIAQLTDVLGGHVGYSLGKPLDMDGVEILFAASSYDM